MNKEDFKLQCKAFKPLIENIIKENVKYYGFNDPIKWTFDYCNDAAIMAVCSRTTNIISINIKSVMISYRLDNLKTVEYYVLHEIRHVFQHLIISDYQKGEEIPINREIVEKWIYEGEHYIKSLDEYGNENDEYFLQDSEMDAYAFSYAVMKYKYTWVSDLYVPIIYGKDFYDIVDAWLDAFKKDNK